MPSLSSPKKWKLLSLVWLFVTPWTIQSMELFRPEYWSGYLFLSPGDLPNPGIKPRSPALQVDSLPAEPCKPVSNLRTKNVFLCFTHFASALLSLHVNPKLTSAVSYIGYVLFTFLNQSYDTGTIISPFFRWRNRGRETWRNWTQVTQDDRPQI